MICQRQRYIVRTTYDEENTDRISDEVLAFARKVNGKEFDVSECFVAAVMKGRFSINTGTTEEILSQVIVPAKEMPEECLECGEAILERFPDGFQVRHYLVDAIDELCCMSLSGFCSKRPDFDRGKHSYDHCVSCPGLGTCIHGASMHCHACGQHTHMGKSFMYIFMNINRIVNKFVYTSMNLCLCLNTFTLLCMLVHV
jgi:hypothetical protein